VLITPRIAMAASLQYGLAGAFDCNVYAIRGPDGVIIIDAGGGVETELLAERVRWCFPDQQVAGLILTHAHPDHAAGAAALREIFACPVFAPAVSAAAVANGDEAAMGLTAGKSAGVYPQDLRLKSCPIDRTIENGDSFPLGGVIFKAIHVRGHSPDSMAYLATIDERKCLFSGDIVFYGGVLGLINAEGSDLAGYRMDLSRLSGLATDALFPGHGLFTLRAGQRHIDAAIERVAGNFVPRTIGQGDSIF
jgi:glyoxylase-like metal-dependent hydrolase (beta-lactamase superfamily II)